jgi:hypothetical protein
MQFFDLSIAPNGMRELQVQGSYVYFLDGSAGGADATIALRKGAGSDSILLKPGQAIKLPDAGGFDTRWIISNYRNQGTIIGTLLIGDGEFFDNRISGTVEVIDGGKARTLGNIAFSAPSYCGAVAAQYAYAQLWNPVGSGKNIVISQLNASSASAGAIHFVKETVMRPNLNAAQPINKKIGAAQASVVQMRRENTTVLNSDDLAWQYVSANASFLYRLTEPIVVPPGTGVAIFNGAVGSDSGATYEYYEESI